MELTPPSLTTSPAPPQQTIINSLPSPPETYCPSERSCNYPSPTLVADSYHVTPGFSSPDSYSMSRGFPPGVSLPSSDSAARAVWLPSDSMTATPPSSSSPSSRMSGALAADFDPFSSYDSCLPGSYSDHDSYPPPSTSSSLAHTPPSLTDPTRTAASVIPPRGLYGYVQDPDAARMKIESPVTYSSPLENAPYVSSALSAPYATEDSPFHPAFQPFMADNPGPAWPRQDYDTSQLYPNLQSQNAELQQDRRPVRMARARRPARKHTTKEEANFQCEVKGCGKFFSRSYNFKSHMETHDEKREYPFPCTTDGCTKKFVRKTDLQRHYQSVHMKERNHRCDYCGRLFARKDTLRR